MRMKNVIAMDKDKYLIRAILGIYEREAKAADSALESLANVFKESGNDVMTRSEIIEFIDQYREILNEEIKINRP